MLISGLYTHAQTHTNMNEHTHTHTEYLRASEIAQLVNSTGYTRLMI